MPKNKNH